MRAFDPGAVTLRRSTQRRRTTAADTSVRLDHPALARAGREDIALVGRGAASVFAKTPVGVGTPASSGSSQAASSDPRRASSEIALRLLDAPRITLFVRPRRSARRARWSTPRAAVGDLAGDAKDDKKPDSDPLTSRMRGFSRRCREHALVLGLASGGAYEWNRGAGDVRAAPR